MQGEDYTPSPGVLVYPDGGDDVQAVPDKVEPHGGKLMVSKMQVTEEIGFIGIFIDTEDNKIAVHSDN